MVQRRRSSLISSRYSLRVSWLSEARREYLLEISDDLRRWTIASDPRIGTGGTLTNTIPAMLGQGGYYFRVRVQP